jgi:hypothetical protein
VVAAEIVVIFTASSGKNILVSFGNRLMRMDRSKFWIARARRDRRQMATHDDFTIVLDEPENLESCGVEFFERLSQLWKLVQRYEMNTPLTIDVADSQPVCIRILKAVRDKAGTWQLTDETPPTSTGREVKSITFPLIMSSKDLTGNILKVRVQLAPK